MTNFQIHTFDSAPEAARPALRQMIEAFGFLPNLQGILAEAPGLLDGYATLWGLFGRSSFSAVEQQVVMMTANFENDCGYCMAGHTTLAKMQKIAPAIIASLRDGVALPDAKLEALRRYSTLVIRRRGDVPSDALGAFLAAGYSKRQALEVVLGVATKIISNYTNHLAHTPLDAFMNGNEWLKTARAAAE